MHNVTFKGADRTVQAQDGELLLTLAKRSGLHLDSSCGGNGSCHQCRVLIHEGQPMREGKPTLARHKQGGRPVYLACQCEVRGNMVVEPAPIHGLKPRPRSSLLGWSVGATSTAALCITDPGMVTGGQYMVEAGGNFTSEVGFAAASRPSAPSGMREIEVSPDVDTALATGADHLSPARRAVLDFSGRLGWLDDRRTAGQPVPMDAFAGTMAHVPGAIERVEWSPLKTRTILDTVGRKPPTGISTGGVISCVQALLQAGMCDADLKLRESRFTRRRPDSEVELVLVAPGVEAQSSVGEVWTTKEAITIRQSRLDAIRATARNLRRMLATLPGIELLAVTGEFGTYVDPELVRTLGIWDGRIEFVPHAAALGAARLAFRQP